MALSKKDIKDIVKQSQVIKEINITDFYTMLKQKAIEWKERVTNG